MNDELYAKIGKIFYDAIQGGCTDEMDSILDHAIEDGDLTDHEVRENEVAIANLFDDRWFTCTVCGWTMPIDEMADDDEWRCNDCAGED